MHKTLQIIKFKGPQPAAILIYCCPLVAKNDSAYIGDLDRHTMYIADVDNCSDYM